MSNPWEEESYISVQHEMLLEDPTDPDAVARRRCNDLLPWLKPTDWVLDVGCRNGAALQCWAEHGIRNVVGLDLFPERAFEKGLCIVKHDMHSIPFGDAAFDAVYSRQTIEHSPDAELMFSEMARVLRPGGILLVEGDPEWNKFHFAEITEDGLRKMASDHRLQVIALSVVEWGQLEILCRK